MKHNMRHRRKPAARDGFTLVELLVAAGILLILATLTVAAYNTTGSADRIRSSARQVQSAFGGARDRCFKASKDDPHARRGLRLLVDASDPSVVTSFVYIGTEDFWGEGNIRIGRQDLFTSPGSAPPADGHRDNGDITTLRGYQTGWVNLYNQGLLIDGARIRIPENSPSWFNVRTTLLGSYSGGAEVLILSSPFAQPYLPAPENFNLVDGQPGWAGQDDDGNGSVDDIGEIGWIGTDDVTDIHEPPNANLLGPTYALEIKPSVLPSQEPLRLSAGIGIDLDNSVIPRNWYQEVSLPKGSALPPINKGYDSGTGQYYFNYWGKWSIAGTNAAIPTEDIYRQYSPRMDVMFSPQGNIEGSLSARGLIHLRLAEMEDISLMRDPADPQAAPMLYSTVFLQTGYVGTFPVDITDADNNGLADDPRSLARIGGTAGR